jgi:hypothetical protein
MITLGSDNFDIGTGWFHILTVIALAYVYIGANPSAEEGEEALEDGAKQVIDVVDSFRLQQTSFDKKSFMVYLKVRDSFVNYFVFFTKVTVTSPRVT